MDPNQWYTQPYGRLPVPQQTSSLNHSSQLFDLPMLDQMAQQLEAGLSSSLAPSSLQSQHLGVGHTQPYTSLPTLIGAGYGQNLLTAQASTLFHDAAADAAAAAATSAPAALHAAKPAVSVMLPPQGTPQKNWALSNFVPSPNNPFGAMGSELVTSASTSAFSDIIQRAAQYGSSPNEAPVTSAFRYQDKRDHAGALDMDFGGAPLSALTQHRLHHNQLNLGQSGPQLSQLQQDRFPAQPVSSTDLLATNAFRHDSIFGNSVQQPQQKVSVPISNFNQNISLATPKEQNSGMAALVRLQLCRIRE
ncbi:PREDICTED: uncharacterized protein LOC106807575 isoform X2 [Priapulus caudatus]|nr:PREDICTED: uncharacterized protein LOC106807575 isoform X2 [Priapulus caudatus]